MRLPKIEKVEADIAETKAKLSELQAKLRNLEKLKIDVENDRMIKALRAESISDSELIALMESFRKNKSEPAEARVSAVEKSSQEETQDADIE
jgi:hypothetical protein